MCEMSGATVLRAGDTVVIAFHGVMTPQLAGAIRSTLEQHIPDVVFLMIDQVDSVLVRRPDQ
jgi:hypothetical protein